MTSEGQSEPPPDDYADDSPGDGPDPLSAFPTEAQVAAAPRQRRRRIILVTALALSALALFGIALASWLALTTPWAAASARGFFPVRASVLVIESTPAGCGVSDGNRQLGVTPLSVSLPPGRHTLWLQHAGITRNLDVTLEAGVRVVHHVDFLPAPTTGRLHLESEPAGAAVTLDGIHSGATPLDLSDVPPGGHVLTFTSGNRVLTSHVTVLAGVAAALTVPFPPVSEPAATVGWATVASPIELQVYDGDALVGSSRNQRVMLIAGRHVLRLVNQAVGFATTATVQVAAGAVSSVTVDVPNGSLSVNAVPWAEVLLDGVLIGETPIANHSVRLGSHELVLRNPKFAEQRRTIVVSLASPARVGVDLRQ